MKIEWAESATTDLSEIYEFIARDSSYYAEQFIDRIIEATGMLIDHPLIGRMVPEANERGDIRELIFQNYRIIYLTNTDYIYIVTVLHASRDLTRLESKPWDVE